MLCRFRLSIVVVSHVVIKNRSIEQKTVISLKQVEVAKEDNMELG